MTPKPKLIGGIALLALIAGASLLWWHDRTPVSAADVGAFLDRTQGSGHLHFTVVRLVTLHAEGADSQVAVAARATALAPLYARVDTSEYLSRTFHADPRSTRDARRLLSENSSLRGHGLQEAGPLPIDPYLTTVLGVKTPGGSTFDFEGIVTVHGVGAPPGIALASGGFVGPSPQGEERSAFAGPTFLAGDPQEDARLHELVSSLESFAQRLAQGAPALEPRGAGPAESRRNGFLSEIEPGRIFRGLATEVGLEQGTTLYLEIKEVSPDNTIRVLLRNEGGWESARSFQGTWSPEPPAIDLVSTPSQAVRGGGPILEDAQTWSLALRWDPVQGFSGEGRHHSFKFQRLSDHQASEAKLILSKEYGSAVDATAPNSLFVGTATSRSTGASEPILLRFISRADRGSALEARLESTTHSWQRSLNGMIVANARRSGGEPIRLRTDSGGAVQDAPAESVLGWRDGLEIRLGVDRGSLLGEDEQFTYRLAVAGDADLHRLEDERLERIASLEGIFRPGIAFDGTLREEQGFTAHVRLEVDSIDRRTGTVTARVGSRSRLNVFREFSGGLEPLGGSVVLTATSKGGYHMDEDFDVPFLKRPAAATLRLALAGNALTGTIEGDPAWKIEFPVGTFLAAHVEVASPDPALPQAASYPPFPKEGGAYLLREGAWLALPRNQGHVVIETVRPDSDLHLSLNVIDLLGQGVGLVSREKDKKSIPYFQFEGKDPRPVARAGAVTILYVGPLPEGRPPIELAEGELMKDGRRRVFILGSAPGAVRFGETRIAAYVRQVASGSVVLTTTSVLEPGPYVLNADTGYELTCE
jgi:hypothetical protein